MSSMRARHIAETGWKSRICCVDLWAIIMVFTIRLSQLLGPWLVEIAKNLQLIDGEKCGPSSTTWLSMCEQPTQQTPYSGTMLVSRWASVIDGGPTRSQHWLTILRLHGNVLCRLLPRRENDFFSLSWLTVSIDAASTLAQCWVSDWVVGTAMIPSFKLGASACHGWDAAAAREKVKSGRDFYDLFFFKSFCSIHRARVGSVLGDIEPFTLSGPSLYRPSSGQYDNAS